MYFINIKFEEAYKLYKEANEKGFILTINAYNSAIKTAVYVKEGADHKWLHIQVNNIIIIFLPIAYKQDIIRGLRSIVNYVMANI